MDNDQEARYCDNTLSSLTFTSDSSLVIFITQSVLTMTKTCGEIRTRSRWFRTRGLLHGKPESISQITKSLNPSPTVESFKTFVKTLVTCEICLSQNTAVFAQRPSEENTGIMSQEGFEPVIPAYKHLMTLRTSCCASIMAAIALSLKIRLQNSYTIVRNSQDGT
jgi:hypothetical protein